MNKVELVVARYGEDVSWVGGLSARATVYDKSGRPLEGAVPLPNIGREAHTYLTHIVRNYPRFSPYVAFLQGDPFFHLAEDGRAGVAELRDKIQACVQSDKPFEGLAWFRLQCDGLGHPHDMRLEEIRNKWAGWGKDIPVAQLFGKLFDAQPPKSFLVRGATGNFVVRRDHILARPVGFYAYALSLVTADPQDAENTGHALERLWQHVFNGNTSWNRTSYPQPE